MARQGARVIAVDPSLHRIETARAHVEQAEVKVELHQSDLAELPFVRADSIDVALSVFALANVDDLDRVFRQVHRVLHPECAFVFSLPHPAYAMLDPDDADGEGAQVVRSYFDRSVRPWFTDTDQGEERIRTIGDLHTSLSRANFRVDTILEPEPAGGNHSAFWTDAMTVGPGDARDPGPQGGHLTHERPCLPSSAAWIEPDAPLTTRSSAWRRPSGWNSLTGGARGRPWSRKAEGRAMGETRGHPAWSAVIVIVIFVMTVLAAPAGAVDGANRVVAPLTGGRPPWPTAAVLRALAFIGLLLAGAVCSACEVVDPGPQDTIGAFVVATTAPTVTNLAYGPNPAQRLDLYLLPKSTTSAPLIVFVHGGGWNAGDRTIVPAPIRHEVDRGWAVASIDYRLVPDVTWPTPVGDVKLAVRYLRSKAATYHLRPDRVVLAGVSAGA